MDTMKDMMTFMLAGGTRSVPSAANINIAAPAREEGPTTAAAAQHLPPHPPGHKFVRSGHASLAGRNKGPRCRSQAVLEDIAGRAPLPANVTGVLTPFVRPHLDATAQCSETRGVPTTRPSGQGDA